MDSESTSVFLRYQFYSVMIVRCLLVNQDSESTRVFFKISVLFCDDCPLLLVNQDSESTRVFLRYQFYSVMIVRCYWLIMHAIFTHIHNNIEG